MMRLLRRMGGWTGPAAIAIYFLSLAGAHFFTYFDVDDVANLYAWWVLPWWRVPRALVIYFSDDLRPMGGLFYRTFYALAGFHPLPFRLACLVLLLCNLYLLFSVAMRITKSRDAALLATLFGAYHGAATELYISTGSIYDILCFTFYFSALLYYFRIRQAGGLLHVRQLVILSVLTIAALDSKEMAVTLPAMLFIYEWLFARPRQLRPAVVTGVIVGVFLVARLARPGPLSGVAAYQPVYTLERYRQTFLSYLDALFYQSHWFTPITAVLLVAGFFLLARLLRSPAMQFGAWLYLVGILPLSFVPFRGAYAVYIPAAGLAIWAGACVAKELAWNGGHNRSPTVAGQKAMFALVAVLLAWVHVRHRDIPRWKGSGDVRATVEKLGQMYPRFPAGSRLLFLREPFVEFTMMFLLREFYGDRSLVVESASRGHVPEHFDYVFDYYKKSYHVVKAKTPPLPDPMLKVVGSFVRMSDRRARDYLVWDIDDGGAWRWTRRRPEMRFALESTGNVQLSVRLVIVDVVLGKIGPQTVAFSVNGRLLDRVRYDKAGEQQFVKAVPAEWLRTNDFNYVLLEIDPTYPTTAGEDPLGVLLISAGLIPGS